MYFNFKRMTSSSDWRALLLIGLFVCFLFVRYRRRRRELEHNNNHQTHTAQGVNVSTNQHHHVRRRIHQRVQGLLHDAGRSSAFLLRYPGNDEDADTAWAAWVELELQRRLQNDPLTLDRCRHALFRLQSPAVTAAEPSPTDALLHREQSFLLPTSPVRKPAFSSSRRTRSKNRRCTTASLK